MKRPTPITQSILALYCMFSGSLFSVVFLTLNNDMPWDEFRRQLGWFVFSIGAMVLLIGFALYMEAENGKED